MGRSVFLFFPRAGNCSLSLRASLCYCHALPNSTHMIVTTAELYKVAYGKFAVGAYNINNAEQTIDRKSTL